MKIKNILLKLVDSINNLSTKVDKITKDEKQWRAATIVNAVNLDIGEMPIPNQYYAVKLCDDPRFLIEGVEPMTYIIPYIAEYRIDGLWYEPGSGEMYGTEALPFKVIAWYPIPE